jgi:hypothetical protein
MIGASFFRAASKQALIPEEETQFTAGIAYPVRDNDETLRLDSWHGLFVVIELPLQKDETKVVLAALASRSKNLAYNSSDYRYWHSRQPPPSNKKPKGTFTMAAGKSTPPL